MTTQRERMDAYWRERCPHCFAPRMDPANCRWLSQMTPEQAQDVVRSGWDWPCVCDLSSAEDQKRAQFAAAKVVFCVVSGLVFLAWLVL